MSSWFAQSQPDHSLFMSSGFAQSKPDHSLFIDDTVITRPSIDEINLLKASLSSLFKLKNLANLKHLLGLEIAPFSTGISVSQRGYTLQLLEETGSLTSKPVLFPMDPKTAIGRRR